MMYNYDESLLISHLKLFHNFEYIVKIKKEQRKILITKNNNKKCKNLPGKIFKLRKRIGSADVDRRFIEAHHRHQRLWLL